MVQSHVQGLSNRYCMSYRLVTGLVGTSTYRIDLTHRVREQEEGGRGEREGSLGREQPDIDQRKMSLKKPRQWMRPLRWIVVVLQRVLRLFFEEWSTSKG